jgi:anthranilate phosphoribosyltransferase
MLNHTWPNVLNPLIAGEQIDSDSLRWAMTQIMEGGATAGQISAFLVALRAKGETAADVDALLDVMLQFSTPLEVNQPVVDTCGTGGDNAHTVNISTMAAIVVAACGGKVVKHGNRAASSKCGSADLLEALGLSMELDVKQVAENLNRAGITFCFAPTFHPAMRFAGPVRKELGVPTVFNILGPLANPARPNAQVVGVANPKFVRTVAEVLHRRGIKALVVRGHDGLDEISTSAPTEVWSALGNELSMFTFDPTEFGLIAPNLTALAGGDAEFNARAARDLFAGERSEIIDAIADAVAINAAAALVALSAVDAEVNNPFAALKLHYNEALAAIRDGRAAKVLEAWI